MTSSEQAKVDHECSACSGSGLDDWDGRQPRDYYPLCPDCLGAGRMPVADAMADAEDAEDGARIQP